MAEAAAAESMAGVARWSLRLELDRRHRRSLIAHPISSFCVVRPGPTQSGHCPELRARAGLVCLGLSGTFTGGWARVWLPSLVLAVRDFCVVLVLRNFCVVCAL